MLDLRAVTDEQVAEELANRVAALTPGTDAWRVFGAALTLSTVHSFTGTRTYPRPDHPDPRKRLPLEYLLVGIIVSLRTTLENEQRAMDQLIARFPTVDALRNATAQQIAGEIAPAGLADSKSVRIVAALRLTQALPGGLESLARREPSDARQYLLALPGFGPKAADCFMTIGLGLPSMVVDVNVFRMAVSLLGLVWERPASYTDTRQVREVKSRLDAAVGDNAFHCQIVHTLLLLEGKGRRGKHFVGSCRVEAFCRECESQPSELLF